LNAFLGSDLKSPITKVEILNPYLEKEFVGDKYSIVDVKARDGGDLVFQIEIQLLIKPWLRERIVYNWSKLIGQQLIEGENYGRVRPTYSIWLLGTNLMADNDVVHRYKLRDEIGRTLNNHGGIWLLELAKFDPKSPIGADDQRWLKFFVEGEKLDDAQLPDWMQTPEMRQAMNTLRVFSEKEREYFNYLSRLDVMREQRTTEQYYKQIKEDAEQVMAKFEGAKSELEGAKSELEKLKAESEKLKAELKRSQEEAERLKAESERLRPAADQREAPLRDEIDGLQPNTLRACNETQPAK
jgi:predicted transposase/invertase (TIGR01784 family)